MLFSLLIQTKLDPYNPVLFDILLYQFYHNSAQRHHVADTNVAGGSNLATVFLTRYYSMSIKSCIIGDREVLILTSPS